MNSLQLQKIFPDVYKLFFSQHKIIYSAPFILSRTGDEEALYSGIGIKQKLPLKMYIGISRCETPGFTFGDITYRDIHENHFITKSLYEYRFSFKEIENYINNTYSPHEKGYKISILTELPSGLGLGFDAIFSLLLSCVIEKVRANGHLNLQEDELYENINNPNHYAYRLFRQAHSIHSELKGYHCIDGGIATSLLHSAFPIVTFHEDTQFTTNSKITQHELLSSQDYKYYSIPLNELSPEKKHITHIPIDFGIIYSGRPIFQEQSLHTSIYTKVHNIMTFADQTLQKYTQNISAKRKPRFIKNLLLPFQKLESFSTKALIGYMSIELLSIFQKLYQPGITEEDVMGFFSTLTKCRYSHNVVKNTGNYLITLINSFQQYLHFKPATLGVSYTGNSIVGGSIVFSTPLETLRKSITTAVFQLQREIPGAELVYTSWSDGIETKGLICEQDLVQKKTSQFVDQTMFIVEGCDANTTFGTFDDIIKSKHYDILLDTINMKIYMQGEKVTSKDLHSQAGTVEMLVEAIQNIGTDISNKQLPFSSYSKSKNDMVGKIVVPLIKTVKEKTNKDIPLECYGSMYNYYLRLKKSKIKFGILKQPIAVTE